MSSTRIRIVGLHLRGCYSDHERVDLNDGTICWVSKRTRPVMPRAIVHSIVERRNGHTKCRMSTGANLTTRSLQLRRGRLKRSEQNSTRVDSSHGLTRNARHDKTDHHHNERLATQSPNRLTRTTQTGCRTPTTPCIHRTGGVGRSRTVGSPAANHDLGNPTHGVNP